MMKFRSTYIIATVFLSLIALVGIPRAHAAEINVTAQNSSIYENQVLQINVTLDTQNDDANAVQGEIIYPANLFKLEQINDGGSVVSLWLNTPAESTSSAGKIDFAGIMPGGFTGSAGTLFSFILQPLTTGTGTIEISSSTILANDGQGTPLPVATTTNASVVVYPSNGSSAPSVPFTDYTPPNPFTPEIVSDPNIFGGKYFLVFDTTDAESGIDHYEVLEAPGGSWHIATSPYLLTDQNLSSDIYVRAVDHAGNFIVEEVPARYPESKTHNMWLNIGIVLLIIVVLLLPWMWHRQRRV